VELFISLMLTTLGLAEHSTVKVRKTISILVKFNANPLDEASNNADNTKKNQSIFSNKIK